MLLLQTRLAPSVVRLDGHLSSRHRRQSDTRQSRRFRWLWFPQPRRTSAASVRLGRGKSVPGCCGAQYGAVGSPFASSGLSSGPYSTLPWIGRSFGPCLVRIPAMSRNSSSRASFAIGSPVTARPLKSSRRGWWLGKNFASVAPREKVSTNSSRDRPASAVM